MSPTILSEHLHMWYSIINDQLIGPYVLELHLTADYYLHFLQNELSVLLEDVPLQAKFFWKMFLCRPDRLNM
jgi:hypothetical protein